MNGKNWEEMFYDIWKSKGNSFIQFLLDAGLDINALNKYGKTMLSYAAKWGNLEITEFLVQKGADGNIENNYYSKPLHIAAQHGRTSIVRYYLNKGMSVDSCDNRKCTPLHYVAESDIRSVSWESCQEMVHFLLDSNANLEAVACSGCTPLLLAAQNANKHMVKLFIKLGANVSCCDNAQWTVLHHSCYEGCLGTVQFLIESKCDIHLNARTSRGETPMLLASKVGHKDIVKLLLKLGADPNCSNNYQQTVLHLASRNGWLDMVKELINAGCDMDAADKFGQTALYWAAKRVRCDVVEFLIEIGANVVLGGESYVLHCVCWAANRGIEGRWVDVAKSLVKKGSDINARDSNHDTALHIAVVSLNTEMIACLLDAGADWNLKNTSGLTAFNHCFESPIFYFKGITLFIEKGAYFQSSDYIAIMKEPLLKQGILQNVDLCTQAVINHFNCADLPKIYKIPGIAERLPSIEKLKFASNGNVAQDIAKTLNDEIQTKGYCDPLNVRPILLSCLCLRSLLEYYDN